MVPKMSPRVSPERTSRRITNHQSRNESSFKAMARMINVAACEPLLPPLEITRGTNSASTTALEISVSNYPMAVAVSISPKKSTISHPALFFTISKRLVST